MNPTKLRFSFYKGGTRESRDIPLGTPALGTLPGDYMRICEQGESHDFGTAVVDLAYGKPGAYVYQTGATGVVTFSNARFSLPDGTTGNTGYYRPSRPFECRMLGGQHCVAVYPQRFAAYLAHLGADPTSVNHSLAVNVDYSAATGSPKLTKPAIPCTNLDYGLVLDEGADLRSFTKGFSLVTNLRLYYADDFNVTPGTPPTGYTPEGDFYPPCSVFAPEKRFGTDADPLTVNLSGQVGSLVAEDARTAARPLDVKKGSGAATPASHISANLRPITHPAELPPITMMNWLVVISERRAEYVGR